MDKNLRVPPHSTESEIALLACIMIDENAAENILENASMKEFYHERNRIIFKNMKQLKSKGQAIDVITITTRLIDTNEIDSVGGVDYLTEIASNVPNAANSEKYLEILKEKSILRDLLSAGGKISELAFDLAEEADNLVTKAQDITSELGEGTRKKSIENISDVLVRHQAALDKLINKQGTKNVSGVTSGFQELDKYTNGFQKSDLIIVAGRPGMGKTSFGLSVLLNAAKAGFHCAFFSLEMSSEQLVRRLISGEGKILQKTLRTGDFKADDFDKHIKAVTALDELPIYLDDTSQITVNQIKAKCRKLFNNHTLDIIFVDYLQIMGSSKNVTVREQQISEISRGLKNLAKEFDVPVVALAQVSRLVEKAENKRPRLSDLRESGAIEQDADIIIFLYRDKVYNPNTTLNDIAEVIIEKHRNGENGTAYVKFDDRFTLFDGSKDVDQADARNQVEKNKLSKSIKKGKSDKPEKIPGLADD